MKSLLLRNPQPSALEVAHQVPEPVHLQPPRRSGCLDRLSSQIQHHHLLQPLPMDLFVAEEENNRMPKPSRPRKLTLRLQKHVAAQAARVL